MARALCWATVLPPMTLLGYGIRAAVPRGFTRTGQISVNVATGTGCALVVVRGLPETDVARVQRWCRDRVPERVRLGMGAKARSSRDLPERKAASCLGEAVHPVVRGSGSLQVLAEPTRGRVTAD